MRHPGNQTERCQGNIHLSIPDHDISVAAKPLDAFVLVNIIMVGVQEITMANHQIQHWISITIRYGGITPKNIEDDPSIVVTGGNLTIAVIADFTAWIGQSFNFVTFSEVNHPKIRIAIASTHFIIKARFFKAGANPILKMKFFVQPALAMDELAFADCIDALAEKG